MGTFHSKRMSLKNQFMLMILIIFIPIFAILLLSGYGEYMRIQNSTDEKAWALIESFKAEQINIINRTQQFLKLLSRVPSIENLDREEGNKFLQEIHEFYPQYSTIVAASPEGLIDICAIPLNDTINVQDRSWFQRLSASGQFVIDNFLISRSAGKASLPFAYPVIDESGQLKAALGAAYNLEHYDSIFSKQDLPDNSEFYVTDRSNRILYFSKAGMNEEDRAIKAEYTGMEIEEITGFSLPEAKKGFLRNRSETNYPMRYWFERLSVGDEANEICLVIGISERILFAEIRETTRRNLILFSLIALTSLILARIFGDRQIFTPIQILQQKTLRIKNGNLYVLKNDRPLPAELQSLSDAFDLMTLNLSEREKERNLAEARLRILFEEASDAIFVSDEQGRLTQANRKASENTGYSREELLNMSITDLDQNYSSEETLSQFLSSFVPGNALTMETNHVRKDGSVYPVELTVTQLRTEEGLRIMGIVRDISERKKLLEEINHSEKLKAIGQLAGGIAHDFNNQLAGIFGYVDLLQMNLEKDTEEYEMVEQISRISLQAKDLTSQLLSFSRKGKRINDVIDINRMINDVFSILENTIDKRIRLVFLPGDFRETIEGDPSQIHNVILNLALNSRDAMPEGGEMKFVTRFKYLDDETIARKGLKCQRGNYIEVSLTDTGFGMSPEVLSQALEPFFTTKPQGAGTGMGLSAAFGAMIAHGGELKIKSEAGKGTKIYLYFPAINIMTSPKKTEDTREELAMGTGRIMLVDDNEIICKTGNALLSSLGYEVHCYLNPLDAIEYFRNNHQSVKFVIIDMIMPEMNGADLFEALRNIDEEVNVLLSSGYSLEGETQGLLSRGVKGFLQKPFTKIQLSKIIEDLF